MDQFDAEGQAKDSEPGGEPPVEFYPAEAPVPLLGPFGIVLALATFFYFFL